MNARDVTLSLGGHWHGRYGTAACPVCQPERRRDQNALTLADGIDGRLLAHCKKSDCAFTDILVAAGLRPGDHRGPGPAETARREASRRAEAEKRCKLARHMWCEAFPIEGTPAAHYLRGARGIRLPTLPSSLRFVPECWHVTARRLPAMIALVEGGDGFAVHRTYLRPDGAGKADVEPAKAMLGPTAGGAVRLWSGSGPLLVAEGIETALSAWVLRGDPAAACWAALSTSGMAGLRLPGTPGRLCIASDGDNAGLDAALALANRAARAGWQVTIAQAPTGADWNDILQGKAVAS